LAVLKPAAAGAASTALIAARTAPIASALFIAPSFSPLTIWPAGV
jgi:hypothetical protein